MSGTQKMAPGGGAEVEWEMSLEVAIQSQMAIPLGHFLK